jgi:hypothetical protein
MVRIATGRTVKYRNPSSLIAVFVNWTKSLTTFSSGLSSSERSIVCKDAQSRSSLVGGGGSHLGTCGLPSKFGGTKAVAIVILRLRCTYACNVNVPILASKEKLAGLLLWPYRTESSKPCLPRAIDAHGELRLSQAPACVIVWAEMYPHSRRNVI